MKILHIATDYRHTAVYSSLFREMKLCNQLVVLVPTSNEIIDSDELNDESCCVKQIPHEKPRMFGVQINAYKVSRYILKNRYCENVDIIHAHYVLNDGSVALQLFSRLNIPYVVSVRATCLSNFGRLSAPHNYLTSLKVLLHANTIVFQSSSALYLLLKMIPVFFRKNILGKHKIIPNGIDKFWLENIYVKNRIVSERNFIVLTVASLELNKNIVSVAKAVDRLNARGYNVTHYIVGAVLDNSILSELHSTYSSKYLGIKNRQDLLDLYREVDIFVMVSHKETFGLVYVEAMSQGLPIVYSKGQGFDGQFDDGTVGYHASPNSVLDIENAILKIVDDYNRISRNAALLCKKYDWRLIASAYTDLYSRIVDDNVFSCE
jgi:glycosyltransferase involved in cell wall biosynthesis